MNDFTRKNPLLSLCGLCTMQIGGHPAMISNTDEFIILCVNFFDETIKTE